MLLLLLWFYWWRAKGIVNLPTYPHNTHTYLLYSYMYYRTAVYARSLYGNSRYDRRATEFSHELCRGCLSDSVAGAKQSKQ